MTISNKYYNFGEVFDDVNWGASCGSKGIASIMATFIYSFNIDTIIEIGIMNGFTTEILSNALSSVPLEVDYPRMLVSCDINENCCKIAENITSGISNIEHKIICKDSRKINWKDYVGQRKVGLCNIDGDHSYKAARDDVKNCIKIIEQDGLVIVHDYAPGQPGVVHAVDEQIDNENWLKIVIPENGQDGDIQSIICQKRKKIDISKVFRD